ncbi:nicotinate (nicotinamide) nucleotide adenylyltransferase [Methylophilaceae bacterium]|nr:nicotinate (nicotinamide) nucleotide adenylyltransferase [Methylophilaceae bacterium]
MKLENNSKKTPLIGLFGGAYDPIHNGHLMIANDLIKKLGLDEFIFIPTGISVTEKNLTPAKHRLQMINLALTNKKMKVSTFEVEESLDSKKSFTFDTLKYFFKKNNAINFFIMGSDNFLQINTWKNWKKLLNYSHIILIDRKISKLSLIKHSEIKELYKQNVEKDFYKLKLKRHGYIYRHCMDYIDIASSEVRKKIRLSKDTNKILPEEIRAYITDNNLYKLTGHEI